MFKTRLMLKVFIWFANRTPEAKKFMKNWKSIIQFNLDDKEYFHIKLGEGCASFHGGEHNKPNVSIRSNQKVFFKILKGEVEPQQAYIFRDYEIKGSIMDGAKFKRLSRIVQESHAKLFSIAQSILK